MTSVLPGEEILANFAQRDLTDLTREISNLRGNLHSVIAISQRALDALDSGRMPPWLDTGVLGQSDADVRRSAIRVDVLWRRTYNLPEKLLNHVFSDSRFDHYFQVDEVAEALADARKASES